MIPSKDNPLNRKIFFYRELVDQVAIVHRTHPGVSAKLVYLIGGRLEKQGRVVYPGLTHRCAHRHRVSRTHGVDSLGMSWQIPIAKKSLQIYVHIQLSRNKILINNN